MKRPSYTTKTPSGTRVQIRIRGVLYRRHFPHGTSPAVIQDHIQRTLTRHRHGPARRTGRFADDAAAYLEAVKAMPSYSDRKAHIDEWVAVFGNLDRHRITADQIAAQLARWRTTPRRVTVTRRATAKAPIARTLTLSASSVNKRRTALMHLFTTLDGKAAPNPVKDVPKLREPDALPRGLPYAAIRELWTVLKDTPTRARLQVMAYVGLPHAQIAALKAEHFHATDGTLLVSGRKKGAGSKPRLVPLTADGIKALKALAKHDAWGPFSRSSVHRDFRAACAKVQALAGLTLRPYDLRHSFGTEVYRVSGDIRATQVLMGHSSPSLTHRYTLGAVDARITAAVSRFGSESTRRSTQKRRNRRK